MRTPFPPLMPIMISMTRAVGESGVHFETAISSESTTRSTTHTNVAVAVAVVVIVLGIAEAMPFRHEQRDVYRVSVHDVAWAHEATKRSRGIDRHARNELLRGSPSLPLKSAEGNGQEPTSIGAPYSTFPARPPQRECRVAAQRSGFQSCMITLSIGRRRLKGACGP